MRGTRNFAGMSDPAHNRQFGRRWTEPRHAGKIAKTVAEAAFKIADNIRASMGLTWAEIIGFRSAA